MPATVHWWWVDEAGDRLPTAVNVHAVRCGGATPHLAVSEVLTEELGVKLGNNAAGTCA